MVTQIKRQSSGSGFDFVQAAQPANPTEDAKTWLQTGDETDMDEHHGMIWVWNLRS